MRQLIVLMNQLLKKPDFSVAHQISLPFHEKKNSILLRLI
jgi:hypothetical protein